MFLANSGPLNGPGNFRMHGTITFSVNVEERAVRGFRAPVSAPDHRQAAVDLEQNVLISLCFALAHQAMKLWCAIRTAFLQFL